MPKFLPMTGPTRLDTHAVNVDFLVEVVEQGNGLDDHSVDLVGGEFEFEAVMMRVSRSPRVTLDTPRLTARPSGTNPAPSC